jgi:NodT family efflux transporter outer membrane factor (OMF) lipoprotein
MTCSFGNLSRGSFGALTALLLSSCAVGPDFRKPEPPSVPQYTAEPLPQATASSDASRPDAQHFVNGGDLPAEWWTLFHSNDLNVLIAQALKNNPDIKSARFALRAAKENVFAQEGNFFPTLNAAFTPARYHNSSVISPTLNTFQPYFNLYQAQISADWTPDIWGGNRRSVEALRAQQDAQRFQLEAAYLTLTSALTAAAIQEGSLRIQIDAAETMVKDETQSLDILKRQLALGAVAGADVDAQAAALAQVEQSLPPLQKQLAQERDLLTVLAGRFPSDQIPQTFELSSLTLPQDLPVSLPSKLVEQRPDIRQSEDNLHAASAQIGVAIANMLPNITLSANDGTTATAFSQLFAPGSGYWMIGANAAQTIFDGGTLLHKERGARAAYEQTLTQYQSTVLTAFQNVADTLYAVRSDADALKAAVASADAAKKSLDVVRLQLKLGSVSTLALLNAEQTYQQAVISLAQARAARFADTVALFQALGGGWWNRANVDAAPAQQADAVAK